MLPFVFLTRGVTNPFIGTDLGELLPFSQALVSQVLDSESIYDFIAKWHIDNYKNSNVCGEFTGGMTLDNSQLITNMIGRIGASDAKFRDVLGKIFEINSSGDKARLSDLVWSASTSLDLSTSSDKSTPYVIKPMEFLKVEQTNTNNNIMFSVYCCRLKQHIDKIKVKYCYMRIANV